MLNSVLLWYHAEGRSALNVVLDLLARVVICFVVGVVGIAIILWFIHMVLTLPAAALGVVTGALLAWAIDRVTR